MYYIFFVTFIENLKLDWQNETKKSIVNYISQITFSCYPTAVIISVENNFVTL